jgi:hypothetical protein
LELHKNKRVILLLFLIVFWNVKLMAITIKASSPSLKDVQTAISSAVNGDTVIVPAGTAAWTSTLVISKGITLIGQTTTDSVAGTAVDKTIIQDNVVRVSGSGGNPIIRVDSVLGQKYDISGLSFQSGPSTTPNSNGAIRLNGNSHSLRLHHCHFQSLKNQAIVVAIWGAIWGVADHNVLELLRSESFTFYMDNWPNPDGSAGVNGDGSWATPTNLGSQGFFFVEDNYLVNTTRTVGTFNQLAGNTDDLHGGRWVFRHNHCYDIAIETHGTENGRCHGGRAREVYNNDFHNAHAHGTGGIRSGVTISHDNTYDGVQPTHGTTLQALRSIFSWTPKTGSPWSGGSGDNPWDSNDTRNGSFTENGFSYNPVDGLYDSGTVVSGSSTSLVDTTKSWAPNQWQYFTAKRLSDNQVALIKSNTSNTLTVVYYTDSGGGAIWKAGDRYQIHRALILLDQPGRGQGDLITGTPPMNSTTRKAGWPHNALEPSYSWNNIYTPKGASVDFKVGNLNDALQQAGRDYYNNTPMPGYKPYTYPHPLTRESVIGKRTGDTGRVRSRN